MANTSITLGEHWETFIKAQLATGKYGSASELVRESLRLLEQRELKIEALRRAIAEGEASAVDGPIDFDEINRAGRERVHSRSKSVRRPCE